MKIHRSQRLQMWLDDKGWSAAELIRRSGVDRDSVYKYLDGKVDNPRGNTFDRLAEPFDKTGLELRHGPISLGRNNAIPLLNANEVGTMAPSQSVGDVWGGVRMEVVSAELAENTFAFEVYDDACAPLLQAGDTAICENVSSATPGKFVVARVTGLDQGVVRKYRPRNAVDNTKFALVATNEDYPDIEVTSENDGWIIGQVVRVMKVV